WDKTTDLQGEIATTADTQERCKIIEIVAFGTRFIIKATQQAIDGQVVARSDIFQRKPEEVFEPHTGHDAINTQRACDALPKFRISPDEQSAHAFLPKCLPC